MPDNGEPTFAEMAVALSLAHCKLGLDLEKTKIIAERIGLSRMGYELIVPDLQRDIELVQAALQLLKDLSDVEPQVRAIVARKKSQRWTRPFIELAESL